MLIKFVEYFRYYKVIWKRLWRWAWIGHFEKVSSLLIKHVYAVEMFGDEIIGFNCKNYSGYAWAEDKEHCEEYGRMLNADSCKVSTRAKKRGLPQVLCILINVLLILNY